MASHSSPQSSLRLFLLFFATIFQLATSVLVKCSDSNFTRNSTYQSNRNQLLSNLSSAGWHTGFSFQTLGKDPDQVFGRALCLGSYNSSVCQTCLLNAEDAIKTNCSLSRRAGLWYDGCFLRYSDTNSITSDEESWSPILYNTAKISNPDTFEEVYSNLMGSLADRAANSTNFFKVGAAKFTGSITLYGLVQCIRDISPDDCYTCLQQYISQFQATAWGQQGGVMLGFQCYMRNDIYQYFNLSLIDATPPALPPELPPQPKGKKKTSTGTIMVITIPLVLAFVLIAGLCVCFLKTRKSGLMTKPLLNGSNPEEIKSAESLFIDLSILRVATINFAEENKLGEGGFGAVYKGVLPDGQEIAVKRLSQSSGQGLGELKNELLLVAKLQHKNLVRLLGVCLEGQEKLLVYEYVPNKSLDQILFDPEKRHLLDWEKRYMIVCAIARGLLYLHEDSQLRIIHRDLKASNILLNAEMNPKISDFGLARLFGGDQTQQITSRVVGTFGYMAPEYVMRGQFSIKSDVFSYGVLVLEIITGKKNSGTFENDETEDLLSFVWQHWTNGTITEVADPSLGQHYPRSELLRCTQIALLCVQENPADRPTMSNVVVMLSSETMSFQTPSKPAFCIAKSSIRGGGNTDSSSKSVPMTQNEVSITDIEPR
ncbi:cysteine-rich receptor-like protein kinase 15 isoform X1 [Carex rostrata]